MSSIVRLTDVFTSISLAVGIMVGILTVISVFLGFLSVYVTVRVMQITRSIQDSIAKSSERRYSKSGDRESRVSITGNKKDKDKDLSENEEPIEVEENEEPIEAEENEADT